MCVYVSEQTRKFGIADKQEQPQKQGSLAKESHDTLQRKDNKKEGHTSALEEGLEFLTLLIQCLAHLHGGQHRTYPGLQRQGKGGAKELRFNREICRRKGDEGGKN